MRPNCQLRVFNEEVTTSPRIALSTMLLWLAHWAWNFLWDAWGDCLWWHGIFPFRDFGLLRTGSSSAVYPGSLDFLCSSLAISSSSAWALGLIWNGPESLYPLAPQYPCNLWVLEVIFMCLYVWVLYWWNYLMSGFMVCANGSYLSGEDLGVLAF